MNKDEITLRKLRDQFEKNDEFNAAWKLKKPEIEQELKSVPDEVKLKNAREPAILKYRVEHSGKRPDEDQVPALCAAHVKWSEERYVDIKKNEFVDAWSKDPQAVKQQLEQNRQAREQGQTTSQAPENPPVMEKSQMNTQGLEKTAAAQKGQSHDYSALQNKPPEKRPDPLTKEGRDAIREQRMAESGLEKYGQNQGNDLHHYRFLKTRDDGGRER
jgi:hypothetical protein